MYLYYLLASAFGGDAKKRQKYLWWGRYLTQFQMFQFVTMMAQVKFGPWLRISFGPQCLVLHLVHFHVHARWSWEDIAVSPFWVISALLGLERFSVLLSGQGRAKSFDILIIPVRTWCFI